MEKRITILSCLIILFMSCSDNQAKKENKNDIKTETQINQSVQEIIDTVPTTVIVSKDLYGTWHNLTDVDGKEIIYTPMEAHNAEVKVSEKTIIVNYGQEEEEFKIKNVRVSDGTFEFDTYSSDIKTIKTITCTPIGNDKAKWSISSTTEYITTNKPSNYESKADGLIMNENNIEEVLDSLYIGLCKAGFQQASHDKFMAVIDDLGIKLTNSNIHNQSKYFILLNNADKMEVISSGNIYFSKKHYYMADGFSIYQRIAEELAHQNNFLFNDNLSSFEWLLNNNQYGFLQYLLTEFGYDKNEKINETVVSHAYKEWGGDKDDIRRDYDVFRDIFAHKDHYGKLHIHENLMQYMVDKAIVADNDDIHIDYLAMLYSYGRKLLRSDIRYLTQQERNQVAGYIAYYIQQYYNLDRYVPGGLPPGSFLSNYETDYPDLEKEYRKVVASKKKK